MNLPRIEKLRTLRITEETVYIWNRVEVVTLKPFDQHRCIFVHIPRTGGTSVSKALFGNLSGSHILITEYQNIFDSHEFKGYFKFAFVRNPWDRLVSAYEYLRAGGAQVEHDLQMQTLIEPYSGFKEFVTSWLVKNDLETSLHFRPQWVYVCDETGKLILDFVGYFETLPQNFEVVCDKLGLATSLGHLNASKRGSYFEYYDRHTKEIVAELYRRDIELFGYDFENTRFRKDSQ